LVLSAPSCQHSNMELLPIPEKLELATNEDFSTVTSAISTNFQTEPQKSLKNTSRLVYSREFLLSFKEKCTEPFPNILEEVCIGYIDQPRFDEQSFTPSRFQENVQKKFQVRTKTRVEHKQKEINGIQNYVPKISMNPNAESKPIENQTGDCPSNEPVKNTMPPGPVVSLETPILSKWESCEATERKDVCVSIESNDETQNTSKSQEVERKSSSLIKMTSPSPIIENGIIVQWKPKKKKETNEHRITNRMKQIQYGKNTVGYIRFKELVSKQKGKKNVLRVPDPHQLCSKRSWDGQLKKWRRELHQFDPSIEDLGIWEEKLKQRQILKGIDPKTFECELLDEE